jgi:hypothetical protein
LLALLGASAKLAEDLSSSRKDLELFWEEYASLVSTSQS